ncbi:hypothetical protein K8O93_19080 [Gordonia bronchialis]|uniref:hypothetical protein n=1 Tax=Gordonia bronchialis TaxID=2054 RepID=UPI001CC1497F|nr:hypothetical protein [Gordonia bronchialis]UAK37234.1 hypothetical protein K8O93_19080 [Gordonia bronchialis]
MTDHIADTVPVWTLATEDTELPAIASGPTMTPERLEGLRGALAALSDVPIATLEAHSLPKSVERSRGIPLASASPLAQHLSQLVKQTPNVTHDGGETLYRMVVPAKVATQMGSGIVKPMASKAATNGIHGALVGGSKIVGQATFVPVAAGKAAAAGAAGGSAATAGTAVAGASVLTIAAPLVLMAVAVGVSARADHQRREAMDRITVLLEKLDAHNLEEEQHRLEGCRSAITKATAILLDEGKLGATLGLEPAVNTIDTAMVKGESRLARWEKALAGIGDGKVEIDALTNAIPTIDNPDGEFYAHLELALAAVAMKRRVLVLQAVEHAQLSQGNPFERFLQTLEMEQREIDELDTRMRSFLLSLSSLQLDRRHGIRDFMFSAGEVDKLLRTTGNLRRLGDLAALPAHRPDITIEIVQENDGALTVFPAYALAS